MPQVGIYCRLSIEDRNKLSCNDSQSIHNQKSMLRDYCTERGWEIFDIYCDDGYSGVDRNRPEFNRLINDCKKGRINIVLCKDQSRFSRDTVVVEQYINDKFLEWGVRFIGVADNSDSESESYGTLRLFTSAYNEMYVRDISLKIRKTLSYKRQQGQFIGSFAPYGYTVSPEDKHRLVIDENTAPVVRLIFEMYTQGEGYRKIVKELNELRILSPSAYKKNTGSNYVNRNADSGTSDGLWTQSTVASILRNEMYTGTLVQGKSHNISYKNKKKKKIPEKDWIRIPDTHEAIIDMQIWKAAQERLKSRVRAGRTEQTLSPLSGKVKCAVCGRPMKRNVYYNKSRTIQYYSLQCASYKTGAMNCTNTKNISGKVLEEKIIEELHTLINRYCQTDKIKLEDSQAEKTITVRQQLCQLKKQHSAAQSRLTQMYKDKLDGLISASDFSLFRENLSKEETELAEHINLLEKQLADCCSQKENEQSCSALIGKFLNFTKLTRAVADEFIDHIEIGQTDEIGRREIHIFWKI